MLQIIFVSNASLQLIYICLFAVVGGAIYIHWGSNSCPTNVTLIYKGKIHLILFSLCISTCRLLNSVIVEITREIVLVYVIP